MRLSCDVHVAANNACRQKLCSHLCLPKQTYPGFSCTCPNSNNRVSYSLDVRGLQCIVALVPQPGTVSSINTRCLLATARNSVEYHALSYFVFLTLFLLLYTSLNPGDPLWFVPVLWFYHEIAEVFAWKSDANENWNGSFFSKRLDDLHCIECSVYVVAGFRLHLKTQLFTASFRRWHSTPS